MIFKVYYYCYYLLYSRVIPDLTPYSTAVFVFGVLLSFLVNGIVDVISILLFCQGIGLYPMVGIAVLSLITSYLLCVKYGKGRKIVSEKPLFFGSHRLSMTIVLVSSLAIISWLFWGPIYTRNLLEKCR
jgi:hypothetical protein